MAEALLIGVKDVVKYTSVNANTDNDKIIQYIKIAQDIHLQNVVGTKLLNKIKADIIANTLSGNYLSLVTNYLKPMLVHWTLVEYLPFSAYTLSNKGVFKHSSENASNVDKNEVDFLISKQVSIATHYTDRFISYINYNQNLFPEYNTNSNGDMFPSEDTNFCGWYL